MPDFGELVNKAKQMASEHPDQVAKGVEKIEELVDKQTSGQYSNQIESAGHMAENYLGAQEPGQPGRQGQPGQENEGGQQDARNQ